MDGFWHFVQGAGLAVLIFNLAWAGIAVAKAFVREYRCSKRR